ncbi:acyltransferase family-domain-containing protein [Whalleya microplaca]|nr:acyltransferase family-domain-containing protein [Whalleya microplaca]
MFYRPESRNYEESRGLIDDDVLDSRYSSELMDEKPVKRIARSFDVPARLWPVVGADHAISSLRIFLRVLQNSICSLLVFLVPSFITNLRHKQHPSSESRTKPLSPTAYLDGLRGVAALISENLFWQLPIVRILHSGRSSVTVFFVISGYVITIKTLSMIYQRKQDRVLESLSGSLFRRPFRLYLPIIASTLIILVLVQYDCFLADPTGDGAPPRGTLQQQLYHWYMHTVHMINPFRPITGRINIYSPPYDGHLWTIPVEFRGSVTVFVLLLAFARAKRWIHIATVSAISSWLVQQGECDQALFCAGLLLAELSLLFPPKSEALIHLTSQNNSPKLLGTSGMKTLRHIWTAVLFVLSLHLLSYPEDQGPKSLGFRTISRWVPAFYTLDEEFIQQFWISIGAVLLILALMYSPPLHGSTHSNTDPSAGGTAGNANATARTSPPESHKNESQAQQPLLQRPFTTALAQYLGRISYALYLAHGSVIHIVGVRWLNPAFAAWREVELTATLLQEMGLDSASDELLDRGWRSYCWQAAWGALVNTVVLFWVSDVFWRAVDVRAVRATRWLSSWAWAGK